jgi:pilus assembly protein CpaF
MTRGTESRWDRPDLAAVPLFAAFSETGVDGKRPGRVRSDFRLPEEEPASAPSQLHVVVRESPANERLVEAEVDWDVAAKLRATASKRFSDRIAQSQVADEAARQELGRAVIMEVVQEATEAKFAAEGAVWSASVQDLMAQAVFDLMFRLGRLQPLVERPEVENIIAVGHDHVFLELVGGRKVPGPPIAASDEDLVQLLQDLASRADPPRVFSDANPDLHLNLAGARLAASAFVTHRPSLVIRLHRLVRITLHDLVRLGTLSPLLASFLAAAVKARLSIVVSGQQGDGKTTLLRALCAEIGPDEVLGTFETERELGLEQLTDQHPVVFSWEARPGSGERGPDGRPVNRFTLQDAIHASFRYALDRQIVGEVRGGEVAQMIMAMESGSGSLSTTHAASAADTMEKLVSCAMQSGEFTRDAAVMKLARCLGLVVQLRSLYVRDRDGSVRKQRVVDEVLAITPGEDSAGYAATTVFRSAPDGPAMAFVMPDHLRMLTGHGFIVAEFQLEAQRQGGLS